MRLSLAACVALLCITSVAAQSLDANVERIAEGEFRIRITFPGVVAPEQAQGMLSTVAASLCSGQTPVWGHYKFKTSEPASGAKAEPASTDFEQDVRCGSVAAATKPGTPAPTTPPSDADRRDVEARTLDYLVKKDQGDFAAADAMFEESVLAQIDRTAWRDQRRSFNSSAGLPEARTVVGISFYDDPADSPQLGRYAAVDYHARYGGRAFYCGYVVWLRQGDGSYRLVREDESLASEEDVRAFSQEQLASLKRQPGCRTTAAAK